MTKKSLRIFLILLVIFSLCTICSSAANINLNLPGTDNTQTNNPVNSETSNNGQTPNNQESDNNTTANMTDTNAIDSNNMVDNNDTTVADNPLDDMQTLQPTAGESSNSGLSVTNIINILLITVGVILILLAIAIMIRLK